jgi:hypothetical protein
MFLASWLGNITSCKVPWEPDHRCRGKGKRHIIEVHYDSEDEEVYEDATVDAYLEQSDDASDSCTLVEASDSCTLGEDSDPCALEGQLDGQDDSTCALAVISHSVDDLTLQQSGDTSRDPHVLAPRHDEVSYGDCDTVGTFSDTYDSHDT